MARVSVPLSIDTYKPEVARAALEAGAHLLNDVHGLQGEAKLATIAGEFGCPVIVMHQEKSFAAGPGDTIEKLVNYFRRSLIIATDAGVAVERVILDPGIGFLKTQMQNLGILARIEELRSLGRPLLLGASRKSFIGNVLGVPATERLEGTLSDHRPGRLERRRVDPRPRCRR